MTDWDKFKVTELKEECKIRKISLTGLKLKQQYIGKLVEYESNSQDAAPAEESIAEKTHGAAIEEIAKDEQPTIDAQIRQDEIQGTEVEAQVEPAQETDTNVFDDRPVALHDEDGQASETRAEDDLSSTGAAENDQASGEKLSNVVPFADAAEETETFEKSNAAITTLEQSHSNEIAPVSEQLSKDVTMEDAEEKPKDAIKSPEPTTIADDGKIDSSNTMSSVDEETRKRKRRSITPPPSSGDILKKFKSIDGEAIVTRRASPLPIPKSPPRKEKSIIEQGDHRMDNTVEEWKEDSIPLPTETAGELSQSVEHQPYTRDRSSSVDKDVPVEPAKHAATRSLYIRNFKRPLNVQLLRSHLVTLAQRSSSVASGEDPIQFFNINNIRSHAFVTFSTISAASRVRTTMHQTRFPDEPQRESLWVDFVPDDKVETWVDQETGGSRAFGRNSGSKLEVVYNDTGRGVEAVFQEIDSSRLQRSSISTTANDRSSLSQRQPPYSSDPFKTNDGASATHPDRTGLIPRSSNDRRRSSPPRQAMPQGHEDQGIGFKGLDDLFSSTGTKPKLYYKLPPQNVIDDRLELIGGLLPERGVSGHPGMKRYTFEKQRGHEEWVDHGPEFGHGKRGQDRLAGVGGRGRGGFRGRGGGRGHFGGDSYRGRGRR